MVYLDRIYTKSGDEGTTGLGDGTRVAKTSPRINAYGTVDELNSVLGVVLSSEPAERLSTWLRHIQNDLFDVGADLCVPGMAGVEPDADSLAGESDQSSTASPLRVTQRQTQTLEEWIDEVTAGLAPLTSFILPGGTSAAAHLHLARTVCRRAEIAVWSLAEAEQINPLIAVYLNRLSDLLFVLARRCNQNGAADILWQPGGSRDET